MIPSLFAAAGLAEAAWLFARVLMYAGMFVIAVVGIVSASIPSRKAAKATVVLWVLFALVFQPWHCFFPFDTADYRDPDVVSHAFEFRVVGACWLLFSALVATTTRYAYHPVDQWRLVEQSEPKRSAIELERDKEVVDRLLGR